MTQRKNKGILRSQAIVRLKPHHLTPGFKFFFNSAEEASLYQTFCEVPPSSLEAGLTGRTWLSDALPPWEVQFDSAQKNKMWLKVSNLLQKLEERWNFEEVILAYLTEARDYHLKGSIIVSRTQNQGEPYYILDEYHNFFRMLDE